MKEKNVNIYNDINNTTNDVKAKKAHLSLNDTYQLHLVE